MAKKKAKKGGKRKAKKGGGRRYGLARTHKHRPSVYRPYPAPNPPEDDQDDEEDKE